MGDARRWQCCGGFQTIGHASWCPSFRDASSQPPASAARPAGEPSEDANVAALRAAIDELRSVQVCGTDECSAPDRQCAACWRATAERGRHAITLQKLLFARLRAPAAPDGPTLTEAATNDKEQAMNGQTEGVALIAAERERQMAAEGWTPEHDDAHDDEALVLAAICYARPHLRQQFWPWERAWFKPSPDDRVRELVKAGALIAAEIDRLRRLSSGRPGGAGTPEATHG